MRWALVTAWVDEALSRLGAAAARRRVVTLLVWGLLLIGLGLAAILIGPAAAGPTAPSTRAQQALDLLDQRIPGAADPTGWVVLVAPDGTSVDDPAVAESVDNLVAGLRDVPGVTAVVDPATGGTVSADRRTAFVPVGVAASAVADTRSAVQVLADAVRAGGPGVELGGVLASPVTEFGPGIAVAISVGVGLAGLVAGLVLGSLRGAFLTMGSVLVGSGVGVAAVFLAGRAPGATGLTGVVAFVAGLAVGGPGAVVLLGRSARPGAVVGGGLLVVVATAGLAVSGFGALTVIGLAVAVVVMASVMAALTLLPALVSLTGGPLVGSIPVSMPVSMPRSTGDGPGWWGRLVTGRPALALGGVAVALAVFVVPALIVGGDRAGGPADRAEELLAAEFGPGATGPLLLTSK
jgi:RND superfamily putative drug exporter